MTNEDIDFHGDIMPSKLTDPNNVIDQVDFLYLFLTYFVGVLHSKVKRLSDKTVEFKLSSY